MTELAPRLPLATIHDDLVRRMARPRHPRLWGLALLAAAGGAMMLVSLVAYTIGTGIGLWGNNIPAAWAFAIINFVWWIGIGHAGTLISAILYLFEQDWRTSISRVTEAMTIFAVMQAALFPLLHLGRPWFAFWLFPYPDEMGVWPQVHSALPWDAAAVTTYFTISLLFWYLGLVPDLALMRDHAKTRAQRMAYGILALGWRGSSDAWRWWKIAYLVLAGIATPLVVSVHSIVSSDFAIAMPPGWHSTIFPPFFVAGAIYSGFAMVLTLVVPLRATYGLQHVITERHLDNIAKLTLATASFVVYGYLVEAFIAAYSGRAADIYDQFVARPTTTIFWVQMFCNVVVPQTLWSRRLRRNPKYLFAASLFMNVGMWAERYIIIVRGLERDHLPGAWGDYSPTWVDLGILAGTLGMFFFLFLLFVRLFPFVPIAEIKAKQEEAR